MSGVYRWTFLDPVTGEQWVVPTNPDKMSDPYPVRNITSKGTAAASGRMLMWEGASTAKQWSFSGFALDGDHIEKLRLWCAKPYQVQIIDHWQRFISVYLLGVDVPEQGPANRTRPTSNAYTATGMVSAVSR